MVVVCGVLEAFVSPLLCSRPFLSTGEGIVKRLLPGINESGYPLIKSQRETIVPVASASKGGWRRSRVLVRCNGAYAARTARTASLINGGTPSLRMRDSPVLSDTKIHFERD